jgi:hypothetical protein
MQLELELTDFSISLSILNNYVQINKLIISEMIYDDYIKFLNSQIDLSNPKNYTFHYINFVDSTLQKKQCYNRFSKKALDFIKKDVKYEIVNIETLYWLFMPFLKKPSSYMKKSVYKIDSFHIHKTLTLFLSCNCFNRSSELFEIYSFYNSKYGDSFISKEEKIAFVNSL